MLFEDRRDGGRRLAALLARYRDEHPVVLGLPRGGVPVAAEVARALGAPLDVVVARKLGAPGMPEYGIGAIAEGGAVFVSAGAARELSIRPEEVSAIAERESAELLRRVRLYRGDRPFPEVRDRTVILVDDGVATGGTARAAIRAVREREPRKLVLAAPVVAFQTAMSLLTEVDDLVYVDAPEDFIAVGVWYRRFGQTSDEEVVECLAEARRGAAGSAGSVPEARPEAGSDPQEREVSVAVGRLFLPATLGVPPGARGVVLFAHGSGSSRKSPRNRFVAEVLRRRGLATVLMDLLTPEEEMSPGGLRFDVALLAERLLSARRWLAAHPVLSGLRAGYFGASTGAAAALLAAAEAPDRCQAVVSRGGRPDLAGDAALGAVRAPVLLVVGGRDEPVEALNRRALELLPGEKRLVVVPAATHLFEEPGALETVAELAAGWFERWLLAPAQEGARA
ncbi:MAG TPA: phosphoribosyltransferase family protein [Anaeromyxobacteraceae bacterium]|nr:phosphoribosyltransferase family protein [Anaeromyxobacteraceae bacterium]